MTGLLRELSEEPEDEDNDDDDDGAPDTPAEHRRPGQTLVPCRLVVRESTGPVPASRA
nr:hypothetical protein [Pseudarthrobacter psychrotolerans]